MSHDPIDDDFDDDSEFDDDEDLYGDCAMMPDGLCMKAGSEECDFECPVMADLIRQEAARTTKKK